MKKLTKDEEITQLKEKVKHLEMCYESMKREKDDWYNIVA